MRALARSVPARAIKTRVSAGKELVYIEGWYALTQANRIFGFDGWDRETVETKCLQQRETRGHCSAVYSARVRITVRADDAVIVRDGHGTGEAHSDSAGEVHDRALKAAETDANKRALATFGKAFGLALYSGAGRPAGSNARAPREVQSAIAEKRQTTSLKPLGEDPLRPEDEAGRAGANGSPEPACVADAEDLAERGANEPLAEAPPSPELDATQNPVQLNGSTGPAAVIDQSAHARVDKSALALSEPHRVRDKEHLRFVASQPCLLCSAVPSDAHHLRFSQPRALGRKVGDDFTVPLCRPHHRDLHDSGNEAAWWHDMGIDALEIANDLWNESVTARLTSAENRA
jgi:hypothetical protein